jgi:addiction module HigA family antidote
MICEYRLGIILRHLKVIVPVNTVFVSMISGVSAFIGTTRMQKILKSLIITEESIMNQLDPVTPGEILSEEFLKPMGLSQYRLAKEIGVPAQRISEIVAGKRRITADTDLRLCRFFGLSNGYWLRAQVACDIEVAERNIGPELKMIRPWSECVAQPG